MQHHRPGEGAWIVAAVMIAACSTNGSTSGGGAGGGAPSASGGGPTGGAAGRGGTDQSTGGLTAQSGGAGNAGAGGASGATATGGAGTGSGGAASTPRRAACSVTTGFPNPLPGARAATKVQGGFGFIEGAVWIAETSTLLFSDMNFGGGDALGPPSQIRRLTRKAGVVAFDVFVPSSGSNGLGLANDGRILAATHDTQSLTYFDSKSGARTDWPLTFENHHFNSPNDLVVRGDGNVYFTDPNYQLGARTSETGSESIYRVLPPGTVTRIDSTITKPNGITLSPDETTLYAGGQSGGIQRFSLDASGVPGPGAPFANGSTDGMTVDCAGNVYATNGDVVVFDPGGNELGRIAVAQTPSNVAFGNADRKTLYITAGDSLFRIDLNVPGMPY